MKYHHHMRIPTIVGLSGIPIGTIGVIVNVEWLVALGMAILISCAILIRVMEDK